MNDCQGQVRSVIETTLGAAINCTAATQLTLALSRSVLIVPPPADRLSIHFCQPEPDAEFHGGHLKCDVLLPGAAALAYTLGKFEWFRRLAS